MRLAAVMLLTALIPVVMPFAWMKEEIYRALGMGKLPEGPIMGYLTRSLSAMYVMHGALVFFVSLDIRRYLPVVKCLAVLALIFGSGMLVLDIMVMPPSWTTGEGPFIIVLGGVMFWLAGQASVEQVEESKTMSLRVHSIKLGVDHFHIVQGEGTIMIDGGSRASGTVSQDDGWAGD